MRISLVQMLAVTTLAFPTVDNCCAPDSSRWRNSMSAVILLNCDQETAVSPSRNLACSVTNEMPPVIVGLDGHALASSMSAHAK